MSLRSAHCMATYPMIDDSEWKLATWEGQRLVQMQEFHALPFTEKVRIIEEMADLAREFAARRLVRESVAKPVIPP